MPESTAAFAEFMPTARSAKTNGSQRFLEKVDGRSASARRQRDLEHAYTADIGGELTTWQRVKIGQAAALTVRAEQLQSAISRGDPDISDDALVRVANALRRELMDLGLGDAPAPADRSKIASDGSKNMNVFHSPEDEAA